VHFSSPASVEADGASVVVDSATMGAAAGQPETIRLEGAPLIERLVITAPQGEVLLLRLCTQMGDVTGVAPSSWGQVKGDCPPRSR
jgi:hypothetical protein